MRRVFISGAVSGVADYKTIFANAEQMLIERGFLVVNPANNIAVDYKGFVDLALKQLMECELIYMIPGWENSVGAKLEHQYACVTHMDIIYGKGAINLDS